MELWSSANPLYLVEQQSDTGELLRAEFSVVQNYVRGNSLQQHSKQSAATFQTVCSNVPNSLQRRSKQSAATFQTVCSDVPLLRDMQPANCQRQRFYFIYQAGPNNAVSQHQLLM